MKIFHNYNCLLQRNTFITAIDGAIDGALRSCHKNRLTHNHLVLCIELLPELGKSLLNGTYVIHVLGAPLRDLKFFCNLGIYFIIERPKVVNIKSFYYGR